jgi:hypothetical protein
MRVKINYIFYNLTIYLIIVTFSGCGITLANSSYKPHLINANQPGTDSKSFQVKKLQSESDFEGLPQIFLEDKADFSKYDFYLFISPSQSTGGYQYLLFEGANSFEICLKKPSQTAIVSMALTNPIALLKVKRGVFIKMKTGYCD